MRIPHVMTAISQRRLLRPLWLWMLLLAQTVLLSSCGFQLRQSESLPAIVGRVDVVSNASSPELARILEREINLRNSSDTDAAQTNPEVLSLVIVLQEESLQRQLLSVFQNGQVAEYELVYALNYQVNLMQNGVLKGSIGSQQETRREYQDDPKQLLAKSKEFDLIVAETRKRASKRILDALPSQVLDLIMQSSPDAHAD